MKKILFAVQFMFLFILLTSCKQDKIININGYDSNIYSLNSIYENKKKDDWFVTIYVYDNSSDGIRYVSEDGNGTIMETELVFRDTEKKFYTKDGTIEESQFTKGDVLICYAEEELETFPGQLIVKSIYYLECKTDKDLSKAILAKKLS